MATASIVGAQSIQTIYSFNSDYYPNGLTLGNDGNFYGTTLVGGSDDEGTVFQMTTNGILTTLASFNVTNGAQPNAPLTLGNDGNLYGTTQYGGSGEGGTVFQVTTNGSLTTLVAFNGSDGESPEASLTLGNDGNFYGTTENGGSGGYGTVFKVTTNGTLTTLVSFRYTNGENPQAALALGKDGNFYGTTSGDALSGNDGTIFQVTTNGILTTLVAFTGGAPLFLNALTQGNDGNFYGTTEVGGSGGMAYGTGSGYGTVFQVTTNGSFTTLVSFNGTNGLYPNGLTLGNDGNFYGTTGSGGVGYTGGSLGTYGTVFRVTPNGALTTLLSFDGTNGQEPNGTLTVAKDGNFYGTTHFGGSDFYGPSEDSDQDGYGTVFRLTLPAHPTLTLQFSAGCPQLNLSGTLGNNFVVQYSTNLAVPFWANLLSLTNLSSTPYPLSDPGGIGQPARFYRAVMQ